MQGAGEPPFAVELIQLLVYEVLVFQELPVIIAQAFGHVVGLRVIWHARYLLCAVIRWAGCPTGSPAPRARFWGARGSRFAASELRCGAGRTCGRAFAAR